MVRDMTFDVAPNGRCPSLYFLNRALQLHDQPNLSADSVLPGSNRNHAYMSQQVVRPSNPLRAFDLQVAPLFGAIRVGEQESHTLAKLRDTLLPKLLSAEAQNC